MVKQKRLIRFLNEFEVYTGAIIFISLTFILTMQVLFRYFFGFTFSWIEELSTILFIWMTYFGISGAALKGKHLKIDFFIEKLKYKYQKWVLIYTDIVTILFCGYIIFPLLNIIENFTKTNSKTVILNLPKDLVYYVVVVGLILTIIRLIQGSIITFKSKDGNINRSGKTVFDDIEETK